MFLKRARLRRLLAIAREKETERKLEKAHEKSAGCFLLEGLWVSADDATDDSGAQLSVNGLKIVTQLESRGAGLKLHELVQPVHLLSACGNEVTCDQMLHLKKMSLIFLHDGTTTTFKNVKFIVSNNVAELLLGRSFLDTIGFTLADF